MTHRPIPTRTLSHRPHLAQLKRQARELLDAFRAGDPAAAGEVNAHYRRADAASFALHDAQLVLARAYGFDSWPKLKAVVDGITVRRLIDAVRAGDVAAVRRLVTARPELVHLDVGEDDEHRALHHAVLMRQPEIVRLLMRQGADARKGIWPHRGATTAMVLARERGYDEIVRIIEEEEARRSAAKAAGRHALSGGGAGLMPAPGRGDEDDSVHVAVATGDVDRLRRLHRDGLVTDGRGLLSHAVRCGRPEPLRVLLEVGLDPDETARLDGVEEVVATAGGPLRTCAMTGNQEMAGILLAHRADANTQVYAASSALYEAYRRGDAPMIALLEAHGGRLTAVAVSELALVDVAKRVLAENTGTAARDTVARDLLWGAIESPSSEIVALALAAVDWPRDDRRWHGILENGLYLGPTSDRPRHLGAFRLVLERCDPDVRSGQGATLLHQVGASRGGLTADDRVAYTTLLLDRGARLDLRDELLCSTPLGWACRWGRSEMVKLLLERGADPIEADAPSWATPITWARKMGHDEIVALLAPLQVE